MTNSMGDTQRITLPFEVHEADLYNATVDLGGEYLIHLKRGKVFKPEQYLENLIVGSNSYSLKKVCSHRQKVWKAAIRI